MKNYMTKLMILLCVCVGCTSVHGVSEITRLEDGIVIKTGDRMEIEEGRWTLLLTIAEPGADFRARERTALLDKVDDVWDHIRHQGFNTIFTQQRKWGS